MHNPFYQSDDIPVSVAIAWIAYGEWKTWPELSASFAEGDPLWRSPFIVGLAQITKPIMLRFLDDLLTTNDWINTGQPRGKEFEFFPKPLMRESLKRFIKNFYLNEAKLIWANVAMPHAERRVRLLKSIRDGLVRSIGIEAAVDERLSLAQKAFFAAAGDNRFTVLGVGKKGVIEKIPSEDFKNPIELLAGHADDPEDHEGDHIVWAGQNQHFGKVDWIKIRVARMDIERVFIRDAVSEQKSRSGMAGRPSSKNLMIMEMQRRAQIGQMLPTLSSEVTTLQNWMQKNHPGEPGFGNLKAAQNALRSEHRKLKATK